MPRYCCKPPLLPARLQAALMAPATPLTPPPALAQEMNNYPRRFAGVSLLAFRRSRLSHRRRPCSTAWLTFVEKPFTAANRAGSSRTAVIFFGLPRGILSTIREVYYGYSGCRLRSQSKSISSSPNGLSQNRRETVTEREFAVLCEQSHYAQDAIHSILNMLKVPSIVEITLGNVVGHYLAEHYCGADLIRARDEMIAGIDDAARIKPLSPPDDDDACEDQQIPIAGGPSGPLAGGSGPRSDARRCDWRDPIPLLRERPRV
jgi:hypothetical protein